jgi:hypothetical protein
VGNRTNRNKLLHELSPRQIIALNVLDNSGTHLEAANAAGVNRTTVSRWVRHHPAFVAEMNTRKEDRLLESQRQALELNALALGNIRVALEAGDAEMSLRWMKTCGHDFFSLLHIGPTESKEVIENKRKRLPSLMDWDNGRTVDSAETVVIAELGDAIS